MEEIKKEFCTKCGVLIEKNMYDKLVYPAFEFKEGKMCHGCGRRQVEKNRKENDK